MQELSAAQSALAAWRSTACAAPGATIDPMAGPAGASHPRCPPRSGFSGPANPRRRFPDGASSRRSEDLMAERRSIGGQALRWRPRRRMWGCSAVAVARDAGLRRDRANGVTATPFPDQHDDLLPNWAFLIRRHPAAGHAATSVLRSAAGELRCCRRWREATDVRQDRLWGAWATSSATSAGRSPTMVTLVAQMKPFTLRRAPDSWRHRTGAGRAAISRRSPHPRWLRRAAMAEIGLVCGRQDHRDREPTLRGSRHGRVREVADS